MASFAGCCALLLLCGCTTLQREAIEPSHDGALEKGLTLLQDGQPKRASMEVNRQLSRTPADPNLHFLNGLAYHRMKAEGGTPVAELAETGYRLALEFDAGHWLAAWHLGLLQIEERQFASARDSFAKAAALRPRNADVQLALAGAAYQASDAPVALLAAERTLALRAGDLVALRVAALSSAALGMDQSAQDYLASMRQVNPDEADDLRPRVDAWRRLHDQPMSARSTRGAPDTLPGTAPALPAILAQAYGAGAPAGSPPGWGNAATGPAPAPAPEPLAPSWYGCSQSLSSQSGSGWGGGGGSSFGGSSYGGGSYGGSSMSSMGGGGDLPALPSPCKGMPLPRMAVVDVTIVRTQETAAYSNGVNLLDGLKVLLSGSWTQNRSVDASGNPTSNTAITRSLGLPSGGIGYSLNIFSAADVMADVIARPSLLALDRMPSNFFSGSVVSVALAGQYGGSVTDKPVGVSLTVTPTFIDEDRLLLAVKGTRSFIEPAQFQGFSQSLTSTSNSVSTNVLMRFDETLILSGLREREAVIQRNGVPLLRDVPLVQSLFSTHADTDFAQHVMIIITLRRPRTLAEVDKAALEYVRSADYQKEHDATISGEAVEALSHRRPALEAILSKLQLSRYRNEFRSGDLSARRFAPMPSLQRTLQDLRQMLAH